MAGPVRHVLLPSARQPPSVRRCGPGSPTERACHGARCACLPAPGQASRGEVADARGTVGTQRNAGRPSARQSIGSGTGKQRARSSTWHSGCACPSRCRQSATSDAKPFATGARRPALAAAAASQSRVASGKPRGTAAGMAAAEVPPRRAVVRRRHRLRMAATVAPLAKAAPIRGRSVPGPPASLRM